MKISQFYSYSVIIAVWTTILTLYFSYWMPKRSHYCIRVPIALISVYFGTIFCNMIPLGFLDRLFASATRFVCVIILCSVCVFFCHKIKYVSALFLSFAGYTVRHMVYLFCQIFTFMLKDLIPDFKISFYISNYLFVFAFYIFFIPLLVNIHRLIKNYQSIIILPTAMTFFVSGIGILVDIIFNNFSMFYFNSINFTVKYWMNSINIVLCIMTLMLMFGYAKQINIQSQVAIMNQLEYERNIQLNRSKETMEIINIKCHDLRHQIRALESISDEKLQKELSEIEKQLRIYDTKVKTGNESLDVILSEKSLICNKRNISLDCIVDGKLVNFLSQQEVSSLFGNIIDNAIESLVKIDNEKKRIITLKVNSAYGGIYIIEENPYEGTIKSRKGQIITSKNDIQHHGYGLKSIQNIVERHKGIFKISTDNNIFEIKIFFPSKENV